MDESIEELPVSYRPDLPDFGVYSQWPVAGESWIHPEDRETVLAIIPSKRILRRFRWDGTYYWLAYGESEFRVKPSMWTSVPAIDLEIGQQVEVLASAGDHAPGIFNIREIFYSKQTHSVEYFLSRGAMPLASSFRRKELRPVKVKHQLQVSSFDHQPPRSMLPPELELLNVGELTG